MNTRSCMGRRTAIPLLLITVFCGAAQAGPVAFNPMFSSDAQSLWETGGEANLNILPREASTRWADYGDIGIGIAGSQNACIGLTVFGDCAGFRADTRTGLDAAYITVGEAKLVSSLGLTKGSVDTQLGFNAVIEVPDSIMVGDFINLNASSNLTSGALNTTFPKITGKVSVGVAAGLNVFGEGCLIIGGCATFNETLINFGGIGDHLETIASFGPFPDISEIDSSVENCIFNGCSVPIPNGPLTVPATYSGPSMIDVLEINTPGLEDKAKILGFPPNGVDLTKTDLYFDFNILSGTIEVADNPVNATIGFNIAKLRLDAPDLPTSSTTVIGNKILSSGEFDDLANLQFDLDGIATVGFGLPPLGAAFEVGPLELRANLVDIDIGPTIDIFQQFEVESELWADLAFSTPVALADGTNVSQLSGAWDSLPEFKLLSPETVVTPEFSVMAMLSNNTDLGFDIEFELTVGEIEKLNLGPIPLASLIPGPLFNFNTEIADLGSANVFNETFLLAGFNKWDGTPFTLLAGNPGPGGGTVPGPTTVPEPGTMVLFGSGALGLFLSRRRRVSRQIR